MTQRRQTLGRNGESQAARFLEARGYRIVDRNVRVDRVEIDVIVSRGDLVAFVEVKSRRAWGTRDAPRHTNAAEAVDQRKQARIRRGAAQWLRLHPRLRARAGRIRFDVVTCLLIEGDREMDPPNETTAPDEPARWSIEHWEAAF